LGGQAATPENVFFDFARDAGANHGRSDVFVAQQLLHRSDVVKVFQQIRGEGMAERAAGYALVEACADGSL
jgi:hypothetical protein